MDIPVALAAAVGTALTARGWSLATAESCTGGLIGAWLTAVPGASTYYAGGIIAYSNAVKHALLDVPLATFTTVGAVSVDCAQAMAGGARQRFAVPIAVATTGIAGPGGGSVAKPVGLVYIAVATPTAMTTVHHVFAGDRQAVQHATATAALHMVLAACQST